MGDNSEIATVLEAALRTGNFAEMQPILERYGTDDFVQDWPQSGERMNREQALRIAEGYEQGSGTAPTFTYRRMLRGGDLIIVEGTVDYGDGVPVSYVGIGELRDGRIAHITEYFANSFEPPAWRQGMTGRMEQVPA